MHIPRHLLVILLVTATPAFAQVPSLLNYQGRVTVGGTNFDGNGEFKFALVNSNGTVHFWNNDGTTNTAEPATAVTLSVAQGLYSTLLGQTTVSNMAALPEAIFTNTDVNLRVWFSPGGTNAFVLLSPDQRLGAAGYALRAATVDNITNIPGDLHVEGTFSTPGWSVGPLLAGTRNIVGGATANTVGTNVVGATISGGGNTFFPNTALGNYSTVSGGLFNNATDNAATIGGGDRNTAGGPFATVAGGRTNVASGHYSVIAGGRQNTANENYTAISGGYENSALGIYATIGGGRRNYADSPYATVGGGWANYAIRQGAVVVGGEANVANGTNAAVGGGRQNSASDTASFIGGGEDNVANGFGAVVAGGINNVASGDSVFIGGGSYNIAASTNTNVTLSSAAVISGRLNHVGAYGSAIAGGDANLITEMLASYAFIGGGQSNSVLRLWSVVVGGLGNSAGSTNAGGGAYAITPGIAAAVVGGIGNNASGAFATVLGGSNNMASGVASLSAGSDNQASGHFTAVSGGISNTAIAHYSRVGGGLDNHAGVTNSSGWIGTSYASVGGGKANTAIGEYSTISGGYSNVAGASYVGPEGIGGDTNFILGKGTAMLGGGFNYARGDYCYIGGGLSNQITGISANLTNPLAHLRSASYAVIPGGKNNTIYDSSYSSVLGGYSNSIVKEAFALGLDANTVGGGKYNQIVDSTASVIPGGTGVTITNGSNSLAFGKGVRVVDPNAIVIGWDDEGGEYGIGGSLISSGPQTITVRANGYFFLTSSNAGVVLTSNATAWASLSDSNAKTDIRPIDPRQVLAKVAEMPVTEWRYKHDPARRYIGPMAQDFHEAFGLGSDDKTISTLDSDGVMYAAIKGLIEEVQELREQQQRVAELEKKLERALEKLSHLPPTP